MAAHPVLLLFCLFCHLVVVLLFPPLMLGVIARTKAALAGRSGHL